MLAYFAHAAADLSYYLWRFVGATQYNVAQYWNWLVWRYTKHCIDYPLLGTVTTVLLILGLLFICRRSPFVTLCVGCYVRSFYLV